MKMHVHLSTTTIPYSLCHFSQSEEQIIQLICQGYSSPEIASLLYKSPRTIEGYRQSILEKSGARNTAGLVVYAIKNGLFKIEGN